jgi:hypothetical protein
LNLSIDFSSLYLEAKLRAVRRAGRRVGAARSRAQALCAKLTHRVQPVTISSDFKNFDFKDLNLKLSIAPKTYFTLFRELDYNKVN